MTHDMSCATANHPFASLQHGGRRGRPAIAGVKAVARGGRGGPLMRLLVLDAPLPLFIAKVQHQELSIVVDRHSLAPLFKPAVADHGRCARVIVTHLDGELH